MKAIKNKLRSTMISGGPANKKKTPRDLASRLGAAMNELLSTSGSSGQATDRKKVSQAHMLGDAQVLAENPS